jgi:predicted RNA-binding Zn ribbon-like protein
VTVLHDPGGRAPAPEPLRLVQAFVNTVDFENGVEELTDPAAFAAALAGIGVLDPDERLGPADLEQGLRVREALRALLLGNNGLAVERSTLDTLEEATRRGRLAVRFDDEGRTRLLPEAGGVDGALGRIVGVVHTSMADGTWPRLKACPRHICRWVFYDRSKNRNSRWCAMSVCGNRVKTSRYRRRAGAPAA